MEGSGRVLWPFISCTRARAECPAASPELAHGKADVRNAGTPVLVGRGCESQTQVPGPRWRANCCSLEESPVVLVGKWATPRPVSRTHDKIPNARRTPLKWARRTTGLNRFSPSVAWDSNSRRSRWERWCSSCPLSGSYPIFLTPTDDD